MFVFRKGAILTTEVVLSMYGIAPTVNMEKEHDARRKSHQLRLYDEVYMPRRETNACIEIRSGQ